MGSYQGRSVTSGRAGKGGGRLIFGGKRRLEDRNVGKSYAPTGKLYLRRRDGSWLIDRIFAARWKMDAARTTTPSRQEYRAIFRPWEVLPICGRKRVNRAVLARAGAREGVA